MKVKAASTLQHPLPDSSLLTTSLRSNSNASLRSNSNASLSSSTSGLNNNIATNTTPNRLIVRPPSQPNRCGPSGSLRRTSSGGSSNDLTIDKLNYRNLGLEGRETEIKCLEGCLQRLLGGQKENDKIRSRQCVFISGYSGCGKTALADTLKENKLIKNGSGLYVKGKFDLHLRNEPYAGIAVACDKICRHSLQLNSLSKIQELRTTMKDKLGMEQLALLQQIIPSLAQLTATSTDLEQQSQPPEQAPPQAFSNSQEARLRFHFLFLKWIRLVAEHFSPLVIVLDDLQWADGSSLDLLEALVIDRQNKGIMVVGIYRSNQVNETHPLTQTIKTLKQQSSSAPLSSEGSKANNDPSSVTTVSSSSNKNTLNDLDVTHIEIDNLKLEAVHSIIQRLLSLDNDMPRTMGLARLCLQKTHGNALFLLQFMDMLYQRHLLVFNIATLTWLWDEVAIKEQTEVGQNVVDILRAKMMHLNNKQEREILQLAACLGSVFSVSRLALIWEELQQQNKHPHHHHHQQEQQQQLTPDQPDENDDRPQGGIVELEEALQKLEDEGYVEAIMDQQATTTSYRWVHDRIQEAAASIMISSQEEQKQFQLQVGEILLLKLDKEELDSGSIFVVVELLNSSSDDGDNRGTIVVKTKNTNTTPTAKDPSKCLQLAQLNLKAMKRALSFSAFDTIANYAAKAIQLLTLTESANGISPWRDHYQLCLEIYSLGAQAEGYLGNIETMESYCQEVIQQEDSPLEDKFPVYHAWVDTVGNKGDVKKAVDIILELLKKFKCNFPKKGAPLNSLRVMRILTKVKSNLREDWFDTLKPMHDKTKSELMRLLDKLLNYFYMMEDDRLPLVLYRMLQWTLEYGYSEYSQVGIAFMGGVFIGQLNDLQSADTCGKLALSLMDKTLSNLTASRTLLIVYEMLRFWKSPLGDCIKPFLKAYEIGLNGGDVESAIWAIMQYCNHRFFNGVPLSLLEDDQRAYTLQARDLQRIGQSRYLSLLWQVILNFRRIPFQGLDQHLLIDGEAVNDQEFKALTQEDAFLLTGYNCFVGILYCHFQAHKQLADLSCEVGYDATLKSYPGILLGVIDVYLKGVSCFAAAQLKSKKKRKYANQGKKCLAILNDWFEQGNPNVHHQLELVKAEYAAFRGRKAHATVHYQTAIRAAARGGFPQDAGLASVRLGEFQRNVLSDREEATFRFQEALRYYHDWGASAIVEHLMDQHADLLPQPK